MEQRRAAPGQILDEPRYFPAEVSRLIGLSAQRISPWLRGYSYEYAGIRRRQMPVVRQDGAAHTGDASFLDLIDLLFVKKFVAHGVPIQRLRRALHEAADVLGTSHFARRTFFTDGRNVFLQVRENAPAILQLLAHGQWVIPDIIVNLADQIQFDSATEYATRWYPLGRSLPVAVDPMGSFGRPHVDGSGVATSNLYDFYRAEGRSLDATAQWFSLSEEAVAAAVQFEERRAA